MRHDTLQQHLETVPVTTLEGIEKGQISKEDICPF